MMFQAHIAIAASFLTLIAGTAFLLWVKKQEAANALAKLVGYITIISSVSGILCASYYAVRYWEDGYYKAPMIVEVKGGSRGMGMMSGMMIDKMMKNPMMKQMMEEMMKDPEMVKEIMEKKKEMDENGASSGNHEDHH